MLQHSAGQSVPQSAYDNSRLVIPCLRMGSLRLLSFPMYGSKAHVFYLPQKTLTWSSSLLSNCRGGGFHFHSCSSCCSFSHTFVCHSTVSKARCNSAYACFARSSLGLCGKGQMSWRSS
ncbi:hypothetical protein ILYODFUR_027075 [Ilyodon furcidens]|uniref:Uncharacterized protein n=1 Tax=Ilyodon furcidens TaxID=33524 RepID=A0ABV0UKS2_9TELE